MQKDKKELFITKEQREQYGLLFEKMEEGILLKLYLDDGMASKRLLDQMIELSGLTEMVRVEACGNDKINPEDGEWVPAIYICDYRGNWKGIAFHGVPDQHELTSFVMGIYNSACRGQEIPEETRRRIKSIKKKLHIKIMVSLDCVDCPELVTAAQKMASLNSGMDVRVYDIGLFPKLKEKYGVKKVPCMVINEGMPMYGRKNLSELLKVLED